MVVFYNKYFGFDEILENNMNKDLFVFSLFFSSDKSKNNK